MCQAGTRAAHRCNRHRREIFRQLGGNFLAIGPLPDVVLLDFRLPDSHDLRLLADVRRLAPSAAVVMMTAFGEDDIARAAEALGARRVIDKPVDMRDLDDLVRAAVSH